MTTALESLAGTGSSNARHGRVRVAPAGAERSWLPWHGFGQDRQFRLFHEQAEEMFKSQSIELHVRASSDSYYTAALLAMLCALGRHSASMWLQSVRQCAHVRLEVSKSLPDLYPHADSRP